MSISESDIVKNLNLGTQAINKPLNAYELYVVELAKLISETFIEYIEQNNISPSGTLAQSIISVPIGGLSFEIQAEEYFKFVDQGVNGTRKDQGSPFSFKTDKPSRSHAEAIRRWIPSRGLSLPASMSSYKSFSYAIATNVKRKGIKANKITENVITEDSLKRIQEQLEGVSGLLVNLVFDKNAKEINTLN